LADPWAAAVAIGNRTVDCIGIVSDAITYIESARLSTSSVVLLTNSSVLANVAKDLVTIWIGVESSKAFAGHVVEPVSIRESSRGPDARVLLGGDDGCGVDISRNVTYIDMLNYLSLTQSEDAMAYLSPHPAHWLPKGRQLTRVDACCNSFRRDKNMYTFKVADCPQGVLLSGRGR
jgi:hypothetical protein